MLPVSCRVVRCFIKVSILHWIQKIVQRGNLFYKGKLFGRNIIWFLSCYWGYARVHELLLQQIKTFCTAVTLLLWKFIVSIGLFVNSRLISFINAIFQVIVYTTLPYNWKTKFPLIMFIKFNLNSNCIFRIISDIRRAILSTCLIALISSFCDVPIHLNCL